MSFFLDTNVLLYSLDLNAGEGSKQAIARDLLAKRDLIVAYVRMQESMQDVSYAQRALTLAFRLQNEGRLSPADAWMIQDLKQRARAGGEAAAG